MREKNAVQGRSMTRAGDDPCGSTKTPRNRQSSLCLPRTQCHHHQCQEDRPSGSSGSHLQRLRMITSTKNRHWYTRALLQKNTKSVTITELMALYTVKLRMPYLNSGLYIFFDFSRNFCKSDLI